MNLLHFTVIFCLKIYGQMTEVALRQTIDTNSGVRILETASVSGHINTVCLHRG
jgi:hypothetical protein